MPKTWKEALLATTVILVSSLVIGIFLAYTDQTPVAELLRTSGFVDVPPPSATGLQPAPSLVAILGLTLRQILQIVVPLFITVKVLNTRRNASRNQRVA